MGDWATIDIVVGPYSWHVEPGDEGALGDVLAGLKVSTNISTDHPVQGTPGPWDASFGIIVDDLAELSAITIGSRVSILALADAPGALMPYPADEATYRPPLVQFLGSVAELSAAPTTKGRTVVTVMCTDRLVDLANVTVGTSDYPAETLANRFERIWAEGPGDPLTGAYALPTGDTLYGTMPVRAPAAASALELLQFTLANQVDHTLPLAHFLMLNPSYDGVTGTFGTELDPARPFTLHYAWKEPIMGNHQTPSNLPFVFVDGPDGWTVEVDVRLSEQVIPADLVELDTTFSKTKATQVDSVTVTSQEGSWWNQYWTPAVPIEWRFDGEQTNLATIADVAVYALPPRGADQWGNDKITILDLPPEFPLTWFSHWYAANAYGLRTPIVIDGVVPEQNPASRPWIVGMFANAEIVFEDGGWFIELEMRADLPRIYDDYTAPTNAEGVYEPYLSPRNMKSDGNEATPNQSSFETSVAAWTSGGTVPPARNHVSVGLAPTAGAGIMQMQVVWGAGGVLPLVQTSMPAMPGRVYTASAYVYVPTGSPHVMLATPGTIGVASSVRNAWTRITLTFTADTHPELIQIWPASVPAAGNMVYVDAFKFERGNVATPYAVNPLSAIRPIDLDPDLTVFDLRLVRRPD